MEVSKTRAQLLVPDVRHFSSQQAFWPQSAKNGHTQAMTIVVSSKPQGTRRRALVAILRKKKMECATNSKAWNNFKPPELSVAGTPQPREAARSVTIYVAPVS